MLCTWSFGHKKLRRGWVQHIINLKKCYTFGALNTRNTKEGGVATHNRGGKCVFAWIFGHKKHIGSGVGATHNKKEVLHAWNFGHKRGGGGGKGGGMQHLIKKKCVMRLEVGKKKNTKEKWGECNT
jgi:hypothetical protein